MLFNRQLIVLGYGIFINCGIIKMKIKTVTIEEIKKKVVPIFQQFGVEYAELFGSVARGEDRNDSDIDMLVSIKKPIGVYKFVGLKQELEDTFGRKVDLVSKNAINKHIKPFVEKDLIKIYGKGQ